MEQTATTTSLSLSEHQQPTTLKNVFSSLDKSTHDDLLLTSEPGSPNLRPSQAHGSRPESPAPHQTLDPANDTSHSKTLEALKAGITTHPSSSSTTSRNSTTTLKTLLASPTDLTVVSSLTTDDATLICPNWNMPESEKTNRRHSSQAHVGAQSFVDTFKEMRRHRKGLEFEIEHSFVSGEDVAVFGRATYDSVAMGRMAQPSFAVWAKIGGEGKVEFVHLIGE